MNPSLFFHPEIKPAFYNAVVEATHFLKALPAENIKQVSSLSDNNGVSTKLIAYKGWNAAIALNKMLEKSDLNRLFLSKMSEHHPKIAGWTSVMGAGTQFNPTQLVTNIARQLHECDETDFPKIFERLFSEMDQLLFQNKIDVKLIAPLEIWLQEPIQREIFITPNLKLRPILAAEFEEFFSYDITNAPRHGMPHAPITMLLEGSFSSDLSFGYSQDFALNHLQEFSEICHWHIPAQQIMHLFKEGCVSIIGQRFLPVSRALPVNFQ